MTAALTLDILEVDGRKVWPLFQPHHYLTGNYSGHAAFMAVMPDGEPVAFASYIQFPHGAIIAAKRGHRTVVLPDFQGLGIGARISDWVGERVVTQLGNRYYSRTSHPRPAAYRDASPHWIGPRASATISQAAADVLKERAKNGQSVISAGVKSVGRDCWQHEYIGRRPMRSDWKPNERDPLMLEIAHAPGRLAMEALYRSNKAIWHEAHSARARVILARRASHPLDTPGKAT